jgi:hypothetical protein
LDARGAIAELRAQMKEYLKYRANRWGLRLALRTVGFHDQGLMALDMRAQCTQIMESGGLR